ncbi:MAG TPA: MFS transporter [Candidatus Dormibacteraeota bacterium]|nr:MFS transporter [Candidatus Dormibacteraeota bacterium]
MSVAAPSEELNPRRWTALFSVLTATFMVLLDISIVNVAIPSVRNNLGANDADIQLIIAGYGLAYALVLITGGRLGDIFGRKRLFLIGMAGFTLASALCGLAQNAVMLDLSRVLQGFMAALMFPQVLSVIQVIFPVHERARAFGFLGAVIGLATIMGPLVGGLIIRDDVTGGSWRWIFLVNVPIGLASMFAAFRVLPESRAPHATRLDLVGVLIASTGLFLLVYPLVEGQTSGWPLWTYVCLALSPVVLALFVLYERSLPAGRFPLVQLGLFRIPAFRVGVVIAALFLMGIPSFFFTLSLMLQIGLGYSPLHAGLTVISFSFGTAVASAMSARVAGRLGRLTISLGAGLLVLGVLGVILTVHLRAENISSLDLVPAFIVSGIGLGTVIAPLLNVILSGVPGRDAGSASGVLTTFQQVGGAVGVAVIGVVFFSLLSARADTVVKSVSPTLRSELIAAHLPPSEADAAVAGFSRCFTDFARQTDPTQAPASCAALQRQSESSSPAARAVFQSIRSVAVARDFESAYERTMLINAALWVTVALLALLLPTAHAAHQRSREAAEAAPAPVT